MLNSTSKTYSLKRELLNFSNKFSRKLSKPDRKFSADMTYGILASGSCLLTDIVDQLHEYSKKVNSVERLTRHLNKGTPAKALYSYLSTIPKWVPQQPVIRREELYLHQQHNFFGDGTWRCPFRQSHLCHGQRL